jgi:putative tryptophan/tyrosine transport system substrate-binding protein
MLRADASGAAMRRRDFISFLASAAAALPLTARAQKAEKVPVVALIRDGSPDTSTRFVAAFRKGLNETGYVEGQNVIVEYHWLEGQYDRLPMLLADVVRREVAVIATPGGTPSCHTDGARQDFRRLMGSANL